MSNEKPIACEYHVHTRGREAPHLFFGVHRRDLETENWHYFETDTGELIHFRKENMVSVTCSLAAAKVERTLPRMEHV